MQEQMKAARPSSPTQEQMKAARPISPTQEKIKAPRSCSPAQGQIKAPGSTYPVLDFGRHLWLHMMYCKLGCTPLTTAVHHMVPQDQEKTRIDLNIQTPTATIGCGDPHNHDDSSSLVPKLPDDNYQASCKAAKLSLHDTPSRVSASARSPTKCMWGTSGTTYSICNAAKQVMNHRLNCTVCQL